MQKDKFIDMKISNSDSDVAHYGVNQLFECEHPFAINVEEIYYKGYTIINNVLDSKVIQSLSLGIDKLYKMQIKEMGQATLVDSIRDANIVRCPLAYDKQFVSLAKHPIIIELAKIILGNNFILVMQNAIINQPTRGNHQTHWHRDLNYQHWTCSKPLAINALFTIDPFSIETGCTHVLPSSHLREEFPTESFVLKNQTPAIAPPGSLILMDAMLYHRAGQNKSNTLRRAINHVIGLPFMAQQIDIPAFAGNKLSVDEFSKSYFGYRWQPAKSVKHWRLRKLTHKI